MRPEGNLFYLLIEAFSEGQMTKRWPLDAIDSLAKAVTERQTRQR